MGLAFIAVMTVQPVPLSLRLTVFSCVVLVSCCQYLVLDVISLF
jgi:hypothetical protein